MKRVHQVTWQGQPTLPCMAPPIRKMVRKNVIARGYIHHPDTGLQAFGNDPCFHIIRPMPLAAPPRFNNLTPPHEPITTIRHVIPPSADADLLAGASRVRNTSNQWAGTAAYDSSDVQTVVMGQVVQAGARMNPSRQAAIGAGIPVDVPAMTVNRVCGSGSQAIASAAQEIMLGHIDCAVAGGMENMDQAPYIVEQGRWGYRMGDGQMFDSMLRDGLNDAFSGEHSGWHTEDLVAKAQISRAQISQWINGLRYRRA